MNRAIRHVDGSLAPQELNEVLRIWLDGNIEAHPFVPAGYWQRNYKAVRMSLQQADLYITVDAQRVITGFLSLQGDWIAGLFINARHRRQGLGTWLLDAAKAAHGTLVLSAYIKNHDAICFYRVNGFSVSEQSIDAKTGEAEYTMRWQKTD